MESWSDKPLSRPFNIPSSRTGSIKNNESEIIALKRRVRVLEERFQGYVYNENPSVIDIIAEGEWVDLAFSGALSETSVGLQSLTGKMGMKNVSGKPYLVYVQATYDGKSLGPGEEFALRLVKNGIKIEGAQCHATASATGSVAKLHSPVHVWMEPNDEIWMQAANFTNSGDIGFERGKMIIHRLSGVGHD